MPKKIALAVLFLLVSHPVVLAKNTTLNQEVLRGQLGTTIVETIVADFTPDYIILNESDEAMPAPTPVLPSPSGGGGGGGGGSSYTTEVTPPSSTASPPRTPIVPTPTTELASTSTPYLSPPVTSQDNRPAIVAPTTSNQTTGHASSPPVTTAEQTPVVTPVNNPLTELHATAVELQKTIDTIIHIQEQITHDTQQQTPRDLTQTDTSKREPAPTSSNLHGSAPPHEASLLDWLILLIIAIIVSIVYNNTNSILKKSSNKYIQ